MSTLHVDVDHHLLMRLEALAVLRQESSPGRYVDPEAEARLALARGLDLLLGELLAGDTGGPEH